MPNTTDINSSLGIMRSQILSPSLEQKHMSLYGQRRQHQGADDHQPPTRHEHNALQVHNNRIHHSFAALSLIAHSLK